MGDVVTAGIVVAMAVLAVPVLRLMRAQQKERTAGFHWSATEGEVLDGPAPQAAGPSAPWRVN